MAIHRKAKPTSVESAADAFVTGAPDAGKTKPLSYDKGLPKGHKRQISLTIAPDLLRRVDERAEAMGTGRAAFISMRWSRPFGQFCGLDKLYPVVVMPPF